MLRRSIDAFRLFLKLVSTRTNTHSGLHEKMESLEYFSNSPDFPIFHVPKFGVEVGVRPFPNLESLEAGKFGKLESLENMLQLLQPLDASGFVGMITRTSPREVSPLLTNVVCSRIY